MLVGGVLVGRDLISSAEIRAQISQIQQYQAAVNTFKGKYGYLPGDIKNPDATQLGFQNRGVYAGTGDGNGILEGFGAYPPMANQIHGYFSGAGENLLFWIDLATAKLIQEGPFPTSFASSYIIGTNFGDQNHPETFVSSAKITHNWILTYSEKGINYFSLSGGDYITGTTGVINSSTGNYNPGLTVMQAYNIDSKIDDGMPGSGTVFAAYQSKTGNVFVWADGVGAGISSATLPTTAKAGSSTTCADNGNAAGVIRQYSVGQNSGLGVNCALSFKFQ